MQYVANYADLQAVFGTDYDAATIHFIEYGRDEGRTDSLLLFAEPGSASTDFLL